MHSRFTHQLRTAALLAVLAALPAPRAVSGQGTPAASDTRSARIEGIVSDSVKKQPLAHATVTVTRLSPEPLEYFTIATDASGHYQVDTLLAGRYELSFSSALLDSLQVVLPPTSVTLAAGVHARVDFAAPSGRTLRMASCPDFDIQQGFGAVVGRVSSVETSQPLRGAVVAVSWPDLRIDPATKRPVNEMRSGGVRTDSLGQYRLCGVPTALHLLIQVQNTDRVGSVIELAVPDDAGVAVLDLAYSAKDSRPAEDSTSAVSVADTAHAVPLTGAAAVSGIVRGAGARPAADVQVQVVDAGSPVRTGEDGRFTIPGLPAGSQLLEARKVGYRIGRYPVSLRAGTSLVQDIQLERIITLDSVKIVAQRTTVYREFEDRRRINAFGTFLKQEQIERNRQEYLSDMMRLYGFTVRGTGIDAKLYFGRGLKSLQLGPCPVNVVIDRMPNQDINLVTPDDVAAIEIYKGIGGAPREYEAGCGLVIIWTKR